MRGRGCLIGLTGVVVGLALIGDAADAAARHYVTTKVVERISASVPGASGVSARIHSFPFLKAAVGGSVDEIGAHVNLLVIQSLDFTDIDVDLRGVRISVGDLVNGRLNVTRITRGTIVLSVTDASLVQAIVRSVPAAAAEASLIQSELPRLRITVNPATRQLVIALPGLARVDLGLPEANLLPCVPQVTSGATRMTLTCQFDHVPTAFSTLTA